MDSKLNCHQFKGILNLARLCEESDQMFVPSLRNQRVRGTQAMQKWCNIYQHNPRAPLSLFQRIHEKKSHPE